MRGGCVQQFFALIGQPFECRHGFAPELSMPEV
jgi:hypothetical protein